ncbi:MAG: type II toxin-antitoxin system VapC family toxin [Alphaproteobacteria bacterium]|nr:type II toxin-antitoxin system VapC family toxin [Alphaproteobacteria bacterium]
MICFDTNIVIAALTHRPPHVATRLKEAVAVEAAALSVAALFELRYGAAKSDRRQENEERLALFLQLPIAILPFEAGDAEEAGDIRAALERAGTPIGPYDVLIAAQARRRSAVLITRNQREFARVPGLRTEDWALPA